MNQGVPQSHRNVRELSPGSFVYAMDRAIDSALCADIIERFEANTDQHVQGKMGQQAGEDKAIKRSTDLPIGGRSGWSDVELALRESLSSAVGLISALHPFFQHNRMKVFGYNLQRTAEGEFYDWHVDSGPGEFTKRQLVAIWYLNDLESEQGGETGFHFQKLSVRPEAGKLILFPPFWTHVHQGEPVRSGAKYIATTWLCVD